MFLSEIAELGLMKNTPSTGKLFILLCIGVMAQCDYPKNNGKCHNVSRAEHSCTVRGADDLIKKSVTR